MEKEPTIEELKNFLGEYLVLKGINTSSVFRCFSPTHEDKHPSMSFYKKGNICNCFTCGEKYNIFSDSKIAVLNSDFRVVLFYSFRMRIRRIKWIR